MVDPIPMHLRGLCRVRIRRSALLHNVSLFRQMCQGSRLCAVVKSNAYGHGLRECVEILAGHVDAFGVNTPSEAAFVRGLDSATPIYVLGLGALGIEEFAQALLEEARGRSFGIFSNVSFVIPSWEHLHRFRQIEPQLSFHLKIDTGLSRLGMDVGEFQSGLVEYFSSEGQAALSCWAGLMTHFANVEDVTDQSYALEQLNRFEKARRAALAVKPHLLCHTAASAAAMLLPEARLDVVRIGISLYGLWPSSETRLSFLSQQGSLPDLRPVLSWEARIVQIHEVSAGASVGYGCSCRVERDSRLAVLPVGYFEGYDRRLSNRAYVLIHGERAPVLGRVSMNMIIVDVSLISEAREGDWAVLLGCADLALSEKAKSGSEKKGRSQAVHPVEKSTLESAAAWECITAEQLADWAGTINYEIVTRILPEIPREII